MITNNDISEPKISYNQGVLIHLAYNIIYHGKYNIDFIKYGNKFFSDK